MKIMEPLVNLLRPYQFKGKARLLSSLIPKRGSRAVTVHGVRMELELSEHIQRMVYLGAYERWETQVVRKCLRPGMCFVDVGANVGYFTLLAARTVGLTGRVVAIEPSRYAADRLDRTIMNNNLHNIRLERLGLGKATGEVILYEPLPDNHSPTMLGDPGTPGSIVPIRRLDDCALDWGLAQIDLLKLDVEGYEPAVLEGASETLAARRVRAIICEFNEHWLRRAGSSPAELRALILGYGFMDATDLPWDEGGTLHTRLFVLPNAASSSRE